MYVCMSVCNTKTFESVDVESSFLICRDIFSRYGSSSHMKVIGSRSRSQKQCKTSIGNNSCSVEERAVRFVCSMGFGLWRIERCDHHLCHVTGSDHVYINKYTHLRVVSLRSASSLVSLLVTSMCCMCLAVSHTTIPVSHTSRLLCEPYFLGYC